MKHVLHPRHHKNYLVLLFVLVTFAGFEALALSLRYWQVGVFWHLAAYLCVFLAFWVVFSHDTHRRHVARGRWLGQELANYLILPTIIYWATVVLLYLEPFARLLQFVWVVFGTAGLAACLWYLKSAFRSHQQAGPQHRQMIFLIKLLASFLAFAAAFGIARFMGYGSVWTALLAFLISALLMRQALFQHHEITHHTLALTYAASVLVALAGYFLYGFWNANFYSAALVLAAVYNTLWGFIHHECIDRNLTRNIVCEYLGVLFVVLVIILSTTDFSQRL